MDTSWSTALWRQYGAAIDMLEKAMVACPDSLWRGRLWSVREGHSAPPEFAEFWYVAYHAIFWFDLYLSGSREEDFSPPDPFAWTEVDPEWVVPEQPYTKGQLRDYLAATRRKCRATLLSLTDKEAARPVEYAWTRRQYVSYLELQMYSMRHVQEHAAQLNLFLGQHGVPDEALQAVARGQDEPGGD